ncbi:M23 family metallopeptidase [Microbaculum sp. FT89]|uniref:M23 family metallopeptidase n=1 Tax=Microbaculum sp. FT89 TaxID=3447298 RepID=UPI003F53CC2D
MPGWAVWLSGATAAAAITWLIGSTAYIAFQDDIYAAAKVHRISVERAYEDRIASLRRKIDEINTRQFLDQQAFEGRLETLLRKQAALEERQHDIAGLIEAAKARKVTLNFQPDTGQQVAENRGRGYGLLTSPAKAAAFDPSRPAPLDKAKELPSRTPELDGGLPPIDRVQASLTRVETMQASVLDTLESTVGGLSERLIEVSGAVGADLPDEVTEGGMGGPLIELRRMSTPSIPDRQIDRISGKLERLDALRAHVGRLPVRPPLTGAIEYTSSFGTRLDPFLKRPALHTGLDFRASTGTPVLATAGGRVTVAGYSGGYGRMVEIDHGDGYTTRYAHMSRVKVEVGDVIPSGTVVGLAGSSGRSTGPHLHYETRVYGQAKNPMPFIRAAELLPEGY